MSAAAQAGLPLGWGTVPACSKQGAHCGWLAQRGITNPQGGSPWQVILVLLGFLTTIAALTPGPSSGSACWSSSTACAPAGRPRDGRPVRHACQAVRRPVPRLIRLSQDCDSAGTAISLLAIGPMEESRLFAR